jgi:hypothetical protein
MTSTMPRWSMPSTAMVLGLIAVGCGGEGTGSAPAVGNAAGTGGQSSAAAGTSGGAGQAGNAGAAGDSPGGGGGASDPGPLANPPPPSAAAVPASGSRRTFIVRRVHLSPDLGFDLDGASNASGPSCIGTPGPGTETAAEDGPLGRDNAFVRSLLPWIETHTGPLQAKTDDAMDRGVANLMFVADNLGDESDQSALELFLLPVLTGSDASGNIVSPEPDAWAAGTTLWYAGPGLYASVEDHFSRFEEAHVTGGMVVGTRGRSVTVWMGGWTLPLDEAVVTFSLPHGIEPGHGTLAGKIDPEGLKHLLELVLPQADAGLSCADPAFAEIASRVRAAADLPFVGIDDDRCDLISFGMDFEIYPAELAAHQSGVEGYLDPPICTP